MAVHPTTIIERLGRVSRSVQSGLTIREGCRLVGVSVSWYAKWRARWNRAGAARLEDGRRVEREREAWIARMLLCGEAKPVVAVGAKVSLSTVYRIAKKLRRAKQNSESETLAVGATAVQLELIGESKEGGNKLTRRAALVRQKLFEEHASELENRVWNHAVRIAREPPVRWWRPSNQLARLPSLVSTNGQFDWIESPADLVLISLRIGRPAYPHGNKRWWTGRIWPRGKRHAEEFFGEVTSAYVALREELRSKVRDDLRPWERAFVDSGEPTRTVRRLLSERFQERARALPQRAAENDTVEIEREQEGLAF